ncbi:MAG: cereblon family protein [Rhodospirillales bacterium]
MFEVDEDDAPAVETEDAPDDALYCVRCGHLVTRSRWAHTPEGGHERVCANPAGRMFKVVSFLEAPGAGDQGSPTDEFSWFPGYAWNFALCRNCSEHLGWRYTSDLDPPLFWGLIKDRLTRQPK